MITLTRADGSSVHVNPDHILSVDANAVEMRIETVAMRCASILFADGHHLTVRETPDEIVRRFTAYQRAVRGPKDTLDTEGTR